VNQRRLQASEMLLPLNPAGASGRLHVAPWLDPFRLEA
jgi:hypothetical protein